jgi:hypothetical protein
MRATNPLVTESRASLPTGDAGLAHLEAVASLLQRAKTTLECELRGRSMGRALPDGARLRLAFGQTQGLVTGEVVAFSAAGRVTVHRIVGRGRFGPARSYLVTRGDGSVLPDHPVHLDAVLGVVREWRTGESWEPVPSYSVEGWRSVLSHALVGLVVGALHVHPDLAWAITVGGVVLRRMIGAVRSA